MTFKGLAWVVITPNFKVAIGSESAPSLHMHKKRAKRFADALLPHIGKCTVARVEYRITPKP